VFMLTFLFNSGLLFHSLHERNLWVSQSLLQACLQTLLQASFLMQLQYCFRNYIIATARFVFYLFCPRESVSPGTSFVTYDKIPPTEPSPSRDQGACLSTTGILSIQQNRNFESDISSNFTGLYSNLVLTRHKRKYTALLHNSLFIV